MIYLCNSEQDNLAVYLDVHALQRQERGFALCGTLGDGHYEGDVMVAVGAKVDITFADRWLNRAGLDAFFERVDREMLESALADAARTMVEGKSIREGADAGSGPKTALSGPHVAYGPQECLPLVVSSGEAAWPRPA